MTKYDEIMQRASELSCTHQHIRATECPICRKQFEDIAKAAQAEEDKKAEAK